MIALISITILEVTIVVAPDHSIAVASLILAYSPHPDLVSTYLCTEPSVKTLTSSGLLFFSIIASTASVASPSDHSRHSLPSVASTEMYLPSSSSQSS